MSFSSTREGHGGGLAFAREGALDPAPRRLHRVCSFARELGRMGTSEADAGEEIEDSIFANGLLPADKPSQLRAWRMARNAAMASYDQGAREAVEALAPAALAEANGDPISAARALMGRTYLFADDEDIADAIGTTLCCPHLAAEMGCFLNAVRKSMATGEATWLARAAEEEAALRKELSGWARLQAKRAADALLAEADDGPALVAALRAVHPLVTHEIAADVAERTLKRHAQPPQRQYYPDPVDPWASHWGEPDAEAMALHEKAVRITGPQASVPPDPAREAAHRAAALMEIEQDMAKLRIVTVDGERVESATDVASQAFALAHDAGDHALAAAIQRYRTGVADEPDEPGPELAAISTNDTLADLCSPPGLVGDIVDWMEASSDRPNRALLLGASLTFVGTLIGRKFATPTNLRSNNYIVTLAPSGHGKDHALGRIKTLAAAAGLDRYVGPARIMSASALRKLVAREPSVSCYMDEFGGFMGQIHDRRAGLHNAMIRFDLLEMFSAAGTFFAGAEYAGEEAKKVYAPNFSISGTSTPEAFWSSLSSLSASDGLLARLILLDVTGVKPGRVKPRLPPNDVPAALIEAVRHLADKGGNLSCLSAVAPTPIIVPLDVDAEAIDTANMAELDSAEAAAGADAMPFLNRVREHALKLALVVAVGCNPDAPIITGPILDWAYRLARLSAATLIRESADRIADNERSAAYGKILRAIKDAGEGGIQPSRIGDRLKGIDKRMREELLDDMVAAGRVRLVKTAPAGGRGGRASERYFAV